MSSPSTDGASTSNPTAPTDDLPKKMITLITSDEVTFEVEEKAALLSETIKNMIEDDCTANGIPLPNMTGKVMAKVIEYLNKHAENPPADDDAAATAAEELKKWNADFVNVASVGQEIVFDIILAANYLNIKSLLDITCQAVADYIKDKSVEEVREVFGIESDFTKEEEEALRKENAWAFE